jgi:hypothetical protein
VLTASVWPLALQNENDRGKVFQAVFNILHSNLPTMKRQFQQLIVDWSDICQVGAPSLALAFAKREQGQEHCRRAGELRRVKNLK